MRKPLSVLVCFLFLSSQTLYAADPPACDDCRVYIITKGKKVPENGYLYNDRAHAEEQARKKAREDEHKRDLDYKLKNLKLDLTLATATTSIALESLRQQKKGQDKTKNDRIAFLETQLVDAQGGNEIVWFSLGIAGGILVTAFAVWGASKLNNKQEIVIINPM